MAEHGQEQLVDVLRDDEAASREERPRADGVFERDRPAHRRADGDPVEGPRRPHEVDDPALDQVVDVDLAGRLLQLLELRERHRRLQALERVAVPLVAHDPELVVRPRIAERGADEEAV